MITPADHAEALAYCLDNPPDDLPDDLAGYRVSRFGYHKISRPSDWPSNGTALPILRGAGAHSNFPVQQTHKRSGGTVEGLSREQRREDFPAYIRPPCSASTAKEHSGRAVTAELGSNFGGGADYDAPTVPTHCQPANSLKGRWDL